MSNSEYKKANYDSLLLRFPKGNKVVLQLEAAKREKTVNELIIDAINAQYNIDLRKKNEQ